MSLFPVFRKKNSGEIARNRLKLLLVADKADCSPEVMQMIKDDMIHVHHYHRRCGARLQGHSERERDRTRCA